MTDNEVIEKMKEIGQSERKVQARWLYYLAEVDRRKLYARDGYSSLFDFVVDELKYAKGTAGKRIYIMRVAEKYPVIYSLIENQKLCLTAISTLAAYLTPENHEELLSRTQRVSTRDLETLLATLFPKPDIKEIIRKLPSPRVAEEKPVELSSFTPRPEKLVPLSQTRVAWHFTSEVSTREKLEKVKRLLRHQYPQGRAEDIVDLALDTLLDKIDPDRKTNPISMPVPKETGHSRYIPRGIKRHVWERDGAQCAYCTPDGKRCAEKGGLQFDHVTPWARGGRSDDPGNIRLLCRTHNIWLAEKTFRISYSGRIRNTAQTRR